VQNRIARAIVGNLRNRNGGGGSPVPAAKTVDPEAYRLYLRGRHFADRWTRENFEQALSSYRAAIERDPAYAPAYAGLAELYSIVDHRPALMDFDPDETYRLGIQFAEKALIVDPESSEAHSALGHIYVHTGQWAEAERHLAEAIRINPNSAGANLWYALLVQILGREIRDRVEIPEPEPERAVGPVGRERGAHRAVERREPGRRDDPRPAQPGSPERGRLLERERGVVEAEPEPGRRRIRLRTEHPRQPGEAAQGDQETCHSRGSRRGLSMRAGPNIMSRTTPYNRKS